MGREEDTRENKYYACFLLASGIASHRLENHEVFFELKTTLKETSTGTKTPPAADPALT